ncbi:hypothetical protein SUGI_0022120 [Cryptomeria japonica]|nr:hypothetical protein SUGI_0022120 [Cryptomeria japonica]
MNSKRVSMNWATILAVMLVVCTGVRAGSGASDEPITEVLAKYGLPIGLLPDSVKSYSLADDGEFKVELEKPCYVQFNCLVYYDDKITGKLTYGKISDLDGIKVRKFFIWVNIKGIEVDVPSSDFIYFKVGIISKKIEISWFESVPTCKDSLGNEPCNDVQTA